MLAPTNENTLFLTPIGSRLYGSDHPGSDYDYYRVLKNDPNRHPGSKLPRANQAVVGDQDNVVLSFAAFVAAADRAAPQALEAMFSAEAMIDHIADYRQGYHASMVEMRSVYSRTARAFSFSPDVKRRFHALRIVHNLNEALETNGRFNPRLERPTVELYWSFAEQGTEATQEFMHQLSTLDLSK